MKVYFFQPKQFNRTENKTNPFFAPLIEICRKNGIQYRVFMPDLRPISGYGENAGSSWFLEWGQIALRKVLHRLWCGSETSMYRFIGKTLALLTFGVFRADICITNAGIYMDFLPAMNPHSRIVDLQHGVIYSTHPGYFDAQGRLLPLRDKESQIEYWVYGEGYRDCFFKNPQNARRLLGKVHVVGDVLREGYGRKSNVEVNVKKDSIVFSLQFTPTLSQKQMRNMLFLIFEILEELEKLEFHKRYHILLKHHPRFLNCFDLSSLLNKHPWVEFTEFSTAVLIQRTFCHITAYSTTAFDYAANGIPTYFFYNTEIPEGEMIFIKEFMYPAQYPLLQLLNMLGNKTDASFLAHFVCAWYNSFYKQFDARVALGLVTNTIDVKF